MLVRDLKVGDILYDTHEVVGSGEAPGELKWLVLYDHTWKLLWTTSSKDPYWNQYVIAGRFVEIGTLPGGKICLAQSMGPEQLRGISMRTGVDPSDTEAARVRAALGRMGEPGLPSPKQEPHMRRTGRT